MRQFLIEKVLPAIVEAWPAEDVGQTILIRQDNARPHILERVEARPRTNMSMNALHEQTMLVNFNRSSPWKKCSQR
jgi:hypothetical protein